MTKRKIRTIVCGATFGQFYLEALKMLPDDFEILGLFTQGSERSKKCAKHYGIDLYTELNQLPNDIDLACVVLRSGVLGGKGTDVTIELLKKGINVVQEQPVHHRDMAICLRVAKENEAIFMTGDLYTHLPTVREFTACTKAIVEKQKLLYIDAAFASQVSYPMIAILMDALPSIRPLKIIGVSKNAGPFYVMTGTIGNIPFTFRVHNEVNPEDPDNYLHLLHRVEIGCEGGSLSLTDTHGPVVWHPRMHVPKNSVSLDDFYNLDSLSLIENSTEIIGSEKAQNYQEIFTKQWPAAIGDDLMVMKDMISGNSNIKMYAQRELLCTSQWHEMTKALGYPDLKLECRYEPLPVSILKDAILKVAKDTKKATNDVFPYNIKTDILSCEECGISELQGVDKDCVERYSKNLDKAVFNSMIYTFQLKGIFDYKSNKHTLAQILKLSNTSPQHHNLIMKWLDLLKSNDYIKYEDELYYGADIITKEMLDNSWNEVRKVWVKGMGSKKTIDYFINNVEQLPQLMSGEQQAVFLLFPEGKIDCAYTMYHDMITVRYLNKLVSEAVIRIAAAKKLSMGSKVDETLRIIEVGAGTGATTEVVATRLKQINNSLNISYLFTDISNYFLSSASEKFKNTTWMDFKIIDVDKNFINQGLEGESADIIIAAGVINNALDTDVVIRGLFNLLVPGGWLLITESIHECREMLISQAFMMTSPTDDRKNTKATFMSIEQWEDVFHNAGAEEVLILPGEDHVLNLLGQKFFAVKK
ncbi:bifunctional Gfo/Idh/MocA family oxidoreductase/class I SAM-dependent methyltransferase [Clostridium estertheticum]|uniref:bifunctional Gfo/Idh/MocA family oxidoreductase/class I SAM-dependent methyltransferase n=1 Tax=Clostridium estertheticum TaxID=238834 RepID=UPI001C0CAA56|nr:bifunctional Gfo/Idh/MocA family oxidoreductase/class I SAM-dependent methyltransferase [Clostridium estertheticum]MBU3186313.1 Gfo/Idh/MocA family oxidoreductase [Clostridium estertheticum]